MVRRAPTTVFAVFAAGALLATTRDVSTQAPVSPPGASIRPQVVPADRHDVSPALRELPPIAPRTERRMPFPPRSVRRGPGRTVPAQIDPALQSAGPTASAPSAIANFDGVNNISGVLPPDTNGDIGPNHYVQWVNLSYAIYSRTGGLLYGPADGSTLWQGFGGPCESTNDGDPIVLYDEHADRWLMSQFALPNFPSGPFYQCIAISQTGNPLGAYHRYQFSFSKLNDYPKFGVWPDGFYMSINQFTCTGFIMVRCSWAGQGVAAFPRTQMLAGAAASMVYFDMASADDTLGGMLPSDLDGPLPAAGTPNYYAQFDDDAWGYSPDQLQIWEFKVNWASPSSSTFMKRAALATAAFDSNLCEYARSCIPQAGSSARLDAIGDRLMYRLQYRNFGAYQTLVTNHTVDVNGGDQAGVRWYEIRIANGAPAIHQQGTYAPDTNHRWMGSAAMDGTGNIAVGYNVSSSQMSPRISFTGRRASDPLGTMTVGEGDVIVGTGAQTHTSSRWGDYSLLAVDPMDACTFWYTTEYYAGTSSAAWRTRVGSFQIDCGGGGGGDPQPPAAPTGLTASAFSSSQINLAWTDNSSNETNFVVERCSGQGCSDFADLATLAANTTSYANTGLPSNTAYTYRVRARNADGSSNSNTASATTLAQSAATKTHVGSLSGSSTKASGGNWRAHVSILVVDNNGSPVSGATVNGEWSNGFTGGGSCTTDATGACAVGTTNIRNRVISATFTVTAVAHATLTYDSAANVQSSIVVAKP
jgi:hypothetical protein